jgi:hypothetical protein
MEPLQLIAYESARRQARQQLLDSLPGAPRVPYEPSTREAAAAELRRAARSRVAGLLRRTADRVDPCPTAA